MSALMRRVPHVVALLARSWSAIPQWFLRLYRRPRLFLAALLGIPLAITSAWLYVTQEHEWRAREERDLIVAAQMASRLIHEELAQTRAVGNALAAWPDFQDAIRRRDRRRLEAQLRLLLNVTPRIAQTLVTDARDVPLALRATGGSASAGASLTRPPRSVSGVYLRDQRSGEKAVELAHVVRAGETTLGTLRSQYRLQELSHWLARIRLEPAGFLYLVDQEGFLVAHPYQLLPGRPKDVSAWPPVAAEASAAGTLVRFTQGKPPRAWTAAVVPLDAFGWRVIAQQPDAVMLEPFHRLLCTFLLLVVALVGLVSLVTLRWARLHQTAVDLLGQQARLLRASEQQRLRDRLRRPPREPERPDAT